MLERRWWGFVVLCHFVSYFEIHNHVMEINRILVVMDVVLVCLWKMKCSSVVVGADNVKSNNVVASTRLQQNEQAPRNIEISFG